MLQMRLLAAAPVLLIDWHKVQRTVHRASWLTVADCACLILQDQPEKRPSWSELFYDLVFVAGASQLAHLLEHNALDAQNVAIWFLYSLTFIFTWLGTVKYQTNYFVSGLLSDFMSLTHMLGVLGMVRPCLLP